FQQEIRRALARFGRNPLLGLTSRPSARHASGDAALAATTLAARRTGALIVFERRQGLRNYIENGIALDAAVSFDLLLNIFTPDTPLHDGAVVIQGDRIAAAACFLPLTSNPELSTEIGSRHRAALGISEETDAVALVVSEESGEISIAVGGRLEQNLEPRALTARARGRARRAARGAARARGRAAGARPGARGGRAAPRPPPPRPAARPGAGGARARRGPRAARRPAVPRSLLLSRLFLRL